MFERYTERARRILFFARYEASEFGALSIEAEHILLGLLREDAGLLKRILGSAGMSVEALREEVGQSLTRRAKTATSLEMPFDAATKRILNFAAEEADRLGHGYIGQEHLLLGVLREERSAAAEVLSRYGLHADDVRKQIVAMPEEPQVEVSIGWGADPIDRIKWLVDDLARTGGNTTHGRHLRDQIHALLDVLKRQPPE
jgi:ATP-dependent Clp protease ATP-binding subunit ClpC